MLISLRTKELSRVATIHVFSLQSQKELVKVDDVIVQLNFERLDNNQFSFWVVRDDKAVTAEGQDSVPNFYVQKLQFSNGTLSVEKEFMIDPRLRNDLE